MVALDAVLGVAPDVELVVALDTVRSPSIRVQLACSYSTPHPRLAIRNWPQGCQPLFCPWCSDAVIDLGCTSDTQG